MEARNSSMVKTHYSITESHSSVLCQMSRLNFNIKALKWKKTEARDTWHALRFPSENVDENI